MEMRSRGQGIAKMVLLILCLSVVGLMLAGFRNGADPVTIVGSTVTNNASSNLKGLQQSLDLLSSTGSEVMTPNSPLRLVLKWQGEFNRNVTDSVMDAVKLAELLGLENTEASEEDGHALSRASGIVDPYTKVSLFWSELDPDTSYVIVTVETVDVQKATTFQTTAEKAGTIMQAAGISAEWNASLQGEASMQGSPNEALVHIEKTIASRLIGITAVENYKDDATYSSSYSVPGLERYVNSGEHKLALQAAVHKNSNDNSNRVTIGLPMITIEY